MNKIKLAAISASVLATSAWAHPISERTDAFSLDTFGTPSYQALVRSKSPRDKAGKITQKTEHVPGRHDYYYHLVFEQLSPAGGGRLDTEFDRVDREATLGIVKADILLTTDDPSFRDNTEQKDVALFTANCGINVAGHSSPDMCFSKGALAGDSKFVLFQDLTHAGSDTYRLIYKRSSTVFDSKDNDKFNQVAAVIKAGLDFPTIKESPVNTWGNAALAFGTALKGLFTPDPDNRMNEAAENAFFLDAGATVRDNAAKKTSALVIYTARTEADGTRIGKGERATTQANQRIFVQRSASRLLDKLVGRPGRTLRAAQVLTTNIRAPGDAFKAAYDNITQDRATQLGMKIIPPIDMNSADKTAMYRDLTALCGSLNIYTAHELTGLSNLDQRVVTRSYLINAGYAANISTGSEDVKNKCWLEKDEKELRAIIGEMKATLAEDFGTYPK